MSSLDSYSHMTTLERLGNIASEIGRAFAAKRRGNKQDMEAAFYRGLELFDIAAKLEPGMLRKKEILRGRELFTASILSDTPDYSLEQHYMNYAIAARLQAGA